VGNMNRILLSKERPKVSEEYLNESSLQDALNHIKDFLTKTD